MPAFGIAGAAWAGWTTLHADFPVEALQKWAWVWKTLVFAIFLPLTLRTRLRMEALVVFIVLSAGSIIITGAIKTLISGGGYGMLNLGVSENSGLYEGSTISMVAIAIIPLILFVVKHGTLFPRTWMLKGFAAALIFACLLIPLGTEARTGLICIGVLVLLLLRDMTGRARAGFVALLLVGGLAALPLLPSSYSQRMSTIEGYQGDESASTRIAVWMWTLDYVKQHPGGGGFGAYRQNRLSYQRVDAKASNGAATVMTQTTDQARAWHSSYFEMLGEQGYPGLALWLILQATGLIRMEALRRRYRRGPEEDRWIASLATALQGAQAIYLVGSLFLALAFASFAYMWMGLQIGLDVYCARRRAAPAAWRAGRTAAASPA